MSLIKLTFAFSCLLLRPPFSPLPSAMDRQPSRTWSYANINMRFVHPLCAYLSRMTQLKQFAFALWKRERACPQCRATQSSPAPILMASARCTPRFRSNSLSKVRKSLRALTELPGHGASISVVPSIHLTPRRRSVSATYCELENGLHWAEIATPLLARQDIGRAQRQRTSTKRPFSWSRHFASISLPLNGAPRPTDERNLLRTPMIVAWSGFVNITRFR
jgi:hypothetical protein